MKVRALPPPAYIGDTMKVKIQKEKTRFWFPKCRAETFQDKRTKRDRTRQRQRDRAIKEFWKDQ